MLCTAMAYLGVDKSIKFSYLSCRHMNTNCVRDGMAFYFGLETLMKNKASRCHLVKLCYKQLK
jgi:hypothetical protein